MPKLKAKKEYPSMPEGLVIGTNVRFYDNGWRVGRLDAWVEGKGQIMPIGKGRHILITEANIKPIEEIHGS
jgi:hypothetical protein